MVKTKLRGIFLAALFLSAPVSAAQIVLDFEDLPTGFPTEVVPFESQGMVIDWTVLSPSVPTIWTNDYSGGGGQSMGFCGWCDFTNGTSLYTQNGTAFELDSFLFGSPGGGTGNSWIGMVTGYLAGGGTVTQAISVADATSALISFDSAWVNLTSVDIVLNVLAGGHAEFDVFELDNITVQAVPVPAAVWLFGSGLAALGWFRRRTTGV